jgi:mRNA interferase MazF
MPERGDLLLVPFPFTDMSASKRRPVLALTAPDRLTEKWRAGGQ